MIPVPKDELNILDIKDKSYGYRRLLSEQYNIINKTENRQKILNKAKKIYDIVVSKKNKGRKEIFYKKLSCNFKLLEEKENRYYKA